MINMNQKLTIVLLSAVVLAGCGAPPAARTSIVDDFPTEPITLKIWRSLDEVTAFTETAVEYNRRHPNVTFDYEYITPDNFEAKVLNALATGQGPDIISIPNDAVGVYQDKLVAMPDNFFDGASPVLAVSSQYAPAVTTDVIRDGEVWGIPFYTDPLTLFWNKGLFNDVFKETIAKKQTFNNQLLIRAPGDWSEVVEVVKLITQRDGDTITRSGIALGTSQNVPWTSDVVATLLLEQGATMVRDDLKGAAFHLAADDDPNFYPSVAVLNFLRGFVDPASDYYTWNASMGDAVDAFIEGKTAMLFGYETQLPLIKQRNPSLNVGTAPIPQIANAKKIVDFARYHVETVTNNATYPQVAWDYLRHVYKFGRTKYVAISNHQDPVKNAPRSTTVKERLFRGDAFFLQIPNAQSWYKGADPEAADTALEAMLDRVSLEKQDPLASAQAAAARLTQILESS